MHKLRHTTYDMSLTYVLGMAPGPIITRQVTTQGEKYPLYLHFKQKNLSLIGPPRYSVTIDYLTSRNDGSPPPLRLYVSRMFCTEQSLKS